MIKRLSKSCQLINEVTFPVIISQETKRQKKTLKKTRKFIVDGVEVSVTTSKIITDNDTKNEEMRFLRYKPAFSYYSHTVEVKCASQKAKPSLPNQTIVKYSLLLTPLLSSSTLPGARN